MKNEYYTNLVEDTKKYGIIKSTIIGRIKFWSDYNEKKQNNFLEGYYWSGYLSARQIGEQTGIPEKTVSKNLKELVDGQIIIKDTFNKKSYDKTGWYRINDVIIPAPESLFPPLDVPIAGVDVFVPPTEDTLPSTEDYFPLTEIPVPSTEDTFPSIKVILPPLEDTMIPPLEGTIPDNPDIPKNLIGNLPNNQNQNFPINIGHNENLIERNIETIGVNDASEEIIKVQIEKYINSLNEIYKVYPHWRQDLIDGGITCFIKINQHIHHNDQNTIQLTRALYDLIG